MTAMSGVVGAGATDGWKSAPMHALDVEPLFPLPVPGARRRRREAAAIKSLNWMAGYPLREDRSVTALQASACARVKELVESQARPEAAPAEKAAYLELLKARSEYDMPDGSGANLVTLRNAAQVSMPVSVKDAPFIADLLPDAAHYFGDGLERMLLSADEFSNLSTPPVVPYMCRGLRGSRRRYLAFVRRLVKAGLFVLAPASDVKERVGAFFVAKKGKVTVRLVIDARNSNRRFARPPGVHLASSEALARLEVELPPGVEPHSPEAERVLENFS